MLARKVDAALNDVPVVVIVAENEGAINGQAMLAKPAQAVGVTAADQVPTFSHVPQVGGIQGLHADEDTAAAAFHHQAECFGVLSDMDARLADPVDTERNQLA